MRSLAVLSFLLLGPSFVTTAPHPPQTAAINYNKTPRPWRRLSDAIIKTIWHHDDETQKSLGTHNGPPHSQSDAMGGQTLAQYGDDMVIRFTVTTPEEARALADASNILFLDIWEFNEDWVDIRIGKDVVCRDFRHGPQPSQNRHKEG